MTAVERVAAVLERARIEGGWIDEIVAHRVLIALDLDDDGKPVEPSAPPTSSNLGHG